MWLRKAPLLCIYFMSDPFECMDESGEDEFCEFSSLISGTVPLLLQSLAGSFAKHLASSR